MTRFLASVRSAHEAVLAVAGGADIVDAKEPSVGALGRVDPATLAEIAHAVAGRRPVSATIGDLALRPEIVAAAVERASAGGADIVKIGLFPGEFDATMAALRPMTRRGVRLVAVLFADRAPDLAGVPARCAAAGFFGVMIDTADKAAGSLIAHLKISALAAFVACARESGLVSGLAGSLRLADIPALAALGADYLGFRSALTTGDRRGDLDPTALRAVRNALDEAIPPARSCESSSATATAGAMSEARERRSGVDALMVSSKPR